jgi:predicted amidohydrolase
MKRTLILLSLILLVITGFAQQPDEQHKPLKIAIVQQNGNPGKVEENREKALKFAKEALEQHPDLILFHEELLIGYHKDYKSLAEPANGVTTKAFQKLLRGTGTLIIYGLTEKDHDKYYISAVVVSENGIVANYHKSHLCPSPGLRNEPANYSPGNELVTFNVKGNLCGVMICYDGDFPEMTRSYANLGCSVLFWMNNREARGNGEVKSLAAQNSIIMPVSCCSGMDEKGSMCAGGSNITGPNGEVIAEIWDKEGIIIGDVFPNQALQMRKGNINFQHMRTDLYYYPKKKQTK